MADNSAVQKIRARMGASEYFLFPENSTKRARKEKERNAAAQLVSDRFFFSAFVWRCARVGTMGRLRKKRMHKNIRDLHKKYRTRRYAKDMDQIHEDLQPENVAAVEAAEPDGDLPGLGKLYCFHCAYVTGQPSKQTKREEKKK